MHTLYYSPASPYVRKVLVMARLRDVADQIDIKTVDAFNPTPDFLAANPLGRLPALVTADGELITDSRVICQFIDTLGSAPPLILHDGPRRFPDLTRAALADGILDSAILVRQEGMRPAEDARTAHMTWHWNKIERALDWFEARPEALNTLMSQGDIALACTLGYLDFRFADRDWRGPRPQLASWFARISQLPVMQATAPAAPQ